MPRITASPHAVRVAFDAVNEMWTVAEERGLSREVLLLIGYILIYWQDANDPTIEGFQRFVSMASAAMQPYLQDL